MTIRDAGLLAIGFVAGLLFASAGLAVIANDMATTDAVIRGIRLKWNPKIAGQG